MINRYIILAPYSDQSIAIVKVLRKNKNNEIHAGIMKEKEIQGFSKYYKNTIYINSKNIFELKKKYIIVPTTAKTTEFYFRFFESCTLNEITFMRHNLFVSNKRKMLEFVDTLGIPVPKTYYYIKDIDNFPIFYKEGFERGGGVRGIAKTSDELNSINNKNLIYQHYIPGKSTFGVSFLAKEGKILEHFIHEEALSIPKSGGSAIIIKEYYNDKLLEYTKKIVKELNYCGWGLAEYKYCPIKNKYYFMEINAKFWASCEFAFIKNKYIKLLFNEENFYNELNSSIRGIIFLDRLMRSSILDIMKNIKNLFVYKRIYYQNPLKVFIITRLSSSMKLFIKGVSKRGDQKNN